MIKYNSILFVLLAFIHNGLFGSEFSTERKSTDSVSSISSVGSASKLKNRLQEAKKESEKQEDIASKRIEVYQSLNATFLQNKLEKDRKKRQEDREKRKSFCK